MGLDVRIKKSLKHFDLDVSFSCEEGKILAIVGPSGAGKTTIVRILAGLLKPEQGMISFNGETWTDTARRLQFPTRKREIGYVFQEFTLFPHLNIYKNVAFAAQDEKTVEGLLKQFDVWHLRDCRPHMISGGERQRCAICQALARNPKVLLLDEPFSALDALTRRKLREMVRALKKELNIPIIHVTHDIREALFLADEILPIVKGRVANKWLLQFMLTAREMGRCNNFQARLDHNEDDEIELNIASKEYIQ
jgi:molybdate transport system ATP-binding protein